MQPRVSIIMAVYNVTDYLQQAIESAQLQNVPGLEILVVDDGSNSQAEKTIRSICSAYDDVTLIRQPHAGQSHARQAGTLAAQGEYALFLDADDVLCPEAVKRLITQLDNAPAAVGAYGTRQIINQHGQIRGRTPLPTQKQAVSGDILPALMQGVPLLTNSGVCIRSHALKNTPFPTELQQGEDWVLWCRLAAQGDFMFIDGDPVIHIRKHQHNISGQIYLNPQLLQPMLRTVYNDETLTSQFDKKTLRKYLMTHRKHIYTYVHYRCREHRRYARALWYKLLSLVILR